MDSNIVVGGGVVTAIAGGPVSIADLGERKTKRLSRVEFNDASQKWEVKPPDGVGSVLFTDADYDTCIAWETKFFNEMLSANNDSPVFQT